MTTALVAVLLSMQVVATATEPADPADIQAAQTSRSLDLRAGADALSPGILEARTDA